MKSIIETISKEIVAAREGETLGIVTNVYTDDKLSRVRGYKSSNDESDERKLLPLRRVLGERDAVMVRNLSALIETTARECPLGAKVYDSCGVLHGILRDALFDEGNGRILSLLVGEKEISPERVIGFGEKAVVLRAPTHDKVLFRKAPSHSGKRTSRGEADPSLPIEVEPLPSEDMPEERFPDTMLSKEESEILLHDYAFLLGRRVRKAITKGDETVASEEEVVTPEVILRAHRSGKLVELTVNSHK